MSLTQACRRERDRQTRVCKYVAIGRVHGSESSGIQTVVRRAMSCVRCAVLCCVLYCLPGVQQCVFEKGSPGHVVRHVLCCIVHHCRHLVHRGIRKKKEMRGGLSCAIEGISGGDWRDKD